MADVANQLGRGTPNPACAGRVDPQDLAVAIKHPHAIAGGLEDLLQLRVRALEGAFGLPPHRRFFQQTAVAGRQLGSALVDGYLQALAVLPQFPLGFQPRDHVSKQAAQSEQDLQLLLREVSPGEASDDRNAGGSPIARQGKHGQRARRDG